MKAVREIRGCPQALPSLVRGLPASEITLARLKTAPTISGRDEFAALRTGFLRLTPRLQAGFTGQLAQEKMEVVDRSIEINWDFRRERPSALKVWETMCRSLGDFKDDTDKISLLFPDLQAQSHTIAINFAECYRFWVDYFYSRGNNGRIELASARRSPALNFDEVRRALIDQTAGVPFLGKRMQEYAEGLYNRERSK